MRMTMRMVELLSRSMKHSSHPRVNSTIHAIYLIHIESVDLPFRPFPEWLLSNLHKISIDRVHCAHWMWSDAPDFDPVSAPDECRTDNLNEAKKNDVGRSTTRSTSFLRVVSNKYKFIPERRNACRNWYCTCCRFFPEIFVIWRKKKSYWKKATRRDLRQANRWRETLRVDASLVVRVWRCHKLHRGDSNKPNDDAERQDSVSCQSASVRILPLVWHDRCPDEILRHGCVRRCRLNSSHRDLRHRQWLKNDEAIGSPLFTDQCVKSAGSSFDVFR